MSQGPDPGAPSPGAPSARSTGRLAILLAMAMFVLVVDTWLMNVSIAFWAVVGGIGASLLLPAMQSLIHGNFEGPAQRKAYALVGAAAAIAAAVGPLLGGSSPPTCPGGSGSCSRW
jgi:MFS family permease